MRILSVETSCDETSAAVVEDGTHVLSNVIATSKDAFARMGGVIPEEAARQQIACMTPVVEQALQEAKSTPEELDALAVTRGPGLLGSLLVGTVTMRILASVWKKPLIGVHHTQGHLDSIWLETDSSDQPEFPLLTLSASGGHTELWLRQSHTEGTLLGATRDDAAGEAFDKGASLLGLPYPGGPSIAKAAGEGSADAFPFPLPLKNDDTNDFSFSGLKTALKYTLRDSGQSSVVSGQQLADLAASYQHAICLHLLDRIERALQSHSEIREVHIVGGVSANTHLRTLLESLSEKKNLRFRTPKRLSYCTDNAAMIGAAAFFLFQEKEGRAWESFITTATNELRIES